MIFAWNCIKIIFLFLKFIFYIYIKTLQKHKKKFKTKKKLIFFKNTVQPYFQTHLKIHLPKNNSIMRFKHYVSNWMSFSLTGANKSNIYFEKCTLDIAGLAMQHIVLSDLWLKSTYYKLIFNRGALID